MREEIINIKTIHVLLQRYYKSIEDVLKVRFIDVYDTSNPYIVQLSNTVSKITLEPIESEEDKFKVYHLINLSWIVLQKLYQNISFVIDEDPNNTSKSESESHLIKLKEMSAKYSKLALTVRIYDLDFLDSITITKKFSEINKWFRKYPQSVPLYVHVTTKLIVDNKEEAKKILDTIELDKTFTLNETMWSSSFLSYGLLPEPELFESIDNIKDHYFKNEPDLESVGEIIFNRMLPANDHVSLYLPQKSWMVGVSLNVDQVKESKIVNIQPKKTKGHNLLFDIKVTNADADKFICVEQIADSSYRLVRYFHWYKVVGGWTYDPTKDPKNPAHIPWADRPENKDKNQGWKYDPTKDPKNSAHIPWADRPENKDVARSSESGQRPPTLPYVPKERLQKLLTKSSNRPCAYNKILEQKVIDSNKITKTQLKLSEIRIGNDVINRIKIDALKIASVFFTDVSKRYKQIYEITTDDLALLSNRVAKSVISTLKLDIIDSHLYYINDFQNIYIKEFVHISKTEAKNSELNLKMFNIIIDGVHNFLFKLNSKFIEVPVELSKIKHRYEPSIE
jgi:hypothetical protein